MDREDGFVDLNNFFDDIFNFFSWKFKILKYYAFKFIKIILFFSRKNAAAGCLRTSQTVIY